jgi:hypothetical protein
MKTTEKELSPIQLWKENGIVKGDFEFQCGGDQMNDTTLTFYNEKGEEVECEELANYIDGEIYNQVEFYVNSDGHYQGESGNVYITLEEDEDEEDGATFVYDKESESEWNESFTEVGYCDLTPAEAEFVKDKIHSIVGGGDGEAINYKKDCILTDEDEELLKSISDKIEDFAINYQMKEAEGEENEWFTYTTDMEETNEANSDREFEYDEDNPTAIIDGQIAILINKSFTIYKAD